MIRRIPAGALSVPVLLTLLLSRAPGTAAQTAPSDEMVRGRLEKIRLILEAGKPASDRWWTGWLAGYAAATLGQGAAGLASGDRDLREDMALGAATTLLGAVGQLVSPMTPSSAPRLFSEWPDSTAGQRLEKLGRAEDLLRRCAAREREGRSWKMHALTAAVNLAGGVIVWKGFDRSAGEGALNFGLNTLVTEAQIWTQPAGLARDAEAYFTDGGRATRRVGAEWALRMRPEAAVAEFTVRF
jgi:hypothetical protein